MSNTRAAQFKDKAMSALGLKKKSALRAPKLTKRVIRWAVRNRSRAAFMAFLSWPYILVFLLLVLYAVMAGPRPNVSLWMVKLQITLMAVLAFLKLMLRLSSVTRSWNRLTK